MRLMTWVPFRVILPATPITAFKTSLNIRVVDASSECSFARAAAEATGTTEQLMNTKERVSWYRAKKGAAQFPPGAPRTAYVYADRTSNTQ